jgi:hypothetical protein
VQRREKRKIRLMNIISSFGERRDALTFTPVRELKAFLQG